MPSEFANGFLRVPVLELLQQCKLCRRALIWKAAPTGGAAGNQFEAAFTVKDPIACAITRKRVQDREFGFFASHAPQDIIHFFQLVHVCGQFFLIVRLQVANA